MYKSEPYCTVGPKLLVQQHCANGLKVHSYIMYKWDFSVEMQLYVTYNLIKKKKRKSGKYQLYVTYNSNKRTKYSTLCVPYRT